MKPSKILIVEDNLIVAEDIKASLIEEGYHVVGVADNSDDALRFIETTKIDLILLDIIIKGNLSGIELADIINANYRIPFIFLTSHSDKITLQKAMESKPKGYILKPFTLVDIRTNLTIALSGKNKGRHKIITAFFIIKTNGLFVKINYKDLLFIKSDGNYLEIFTFQRKYVTRMSFAELLVIVGNKKFAQVHKSYLAYLPNITQFNHTEVCYEDIIIPLGRSFKQDFLEKMHSFK